MNKEEEKDRIVLLFNENIKNQEPNLCNENVNHCGKEGHWLETKMGITHNSNNEPDIGGFEMKKQSKKITLGDFSASEYAFSPQNKRICINTYNEWNEEINMSKYEFIHYFGSPNPIKANRYSWSGKCVPKYNRWNEFGQNLLILENNDICIYYSFSHDTRVEKHTFPDYLKKEKLLIVIWKMEKMKEHIDNKFNKNGFFMCRKKKQVYDSISFGKPFDFHYFILNIKENNIIFDSGMYVGNTRNYSHFRALHSRFWKELIVNND